MKIFIDSNVWLASFISRGVCYDVVTYCNDEHTIITSDFVLKEVEDKLKNKFKYPEDEIVSAQSIMKTGTTITEEAPLQSKIARDKDDDHIIAAAVKAQADCILTGDKDLLVLKTVRSIPIVPPGAFMMFEELWKTKKLSLLKI